MTARDAWHVAVVGRVGEEKMKNFVLRCVVRYRIWLDEGGQDMIEYALLAGFVAVMAGATMPEVAGRIRGIYSKTRSILALAGGGHGHGGDDDDD